MQASLQPPPNEDGSDQVTATDDPLAPPDTWTQDDPDPLHPVIVDLDADDPERREVEEFFKASLRDTLKELKQIKSVKRIQSIGLWQSYAIKKRQLQMRAKAEGKDDEYAEAYEKVSM